jgi:hypothetical protein
VLALASSFGGREKLVAEIFVHVEKTKTMLGVGEKFLIERIRPTSNNFIFKFTELAFHGFQLAPQQNIYI